MLQSCQTLVVRLGVVSKVGEMRSLGIWRATDETDLHEKVLGTLPLRPWMTLKVTALDSHPNDPGKNDAAA